MGGAYTIYAYFNSGQIQGVLNAIVMLVGSGGTNGDYLSIIRVAAMLGLFLAVTLGFVKARGEDAAQYLVMVAIFYSTLFVPRVAVTIEEVGGGGGAPVVVNNVPLGLAFFAATTSHIGYWLTDKTETFFSLPSTELQLNKHGLMGGARALREAQGASIQDPVLASDMTSFMRDCINPELLTNTAAINGLMKSTNLYVDFLGLSLINPGRTVTFLNAGNLNCSVAYTNIGARLNPAVAGTMAEIAAIISPSSTPASANAIFASMFPAAESMIMTSSATAADGIRQRMMINMMNDTSTNLAQIMNDPAAAQTALGTAMAASSANAGYRITAKLAAETLPIIRNAIELVIIGVFPIILILIIIAGSKGGMILRSYVMTMLWVQLWAPIYAIVNYVGTMAHARSARAALAGIDGVAISNAAAFVNTTISSEAMVGILTISVPMIALAIIKGGEVATAGIASSMTGGATSAATRAGEAVGSGNIQMGNTSWGVGNYNNTSANKSNTNGSSIHGGFQNQLDNGNLGFRAPNGTYKEQQAVNSGALSAPSGVTQATGLLERAAISKQAARNDAVSAGDGIVSTFSNGSYYRTGGAKDRSVNDEVSQTNKFGNDQSAGNRHEGSTTVSGTSAMANSSSMAARFGVKLPGSGGENGAKEGAAAAEDASKNLSKMAKLAKALGFIDGGMQQQIAEDYKKIRQFGSAEQVTAAASNLDSISQSAAKTHGQKVTSSDGSSGGTETSAKLDHAKSLLKNAQASLSDSQESVNQASRSLENRSGLNYDSLAAGDGHAYAALLDKMAGMSPSQREAFMTQLLGGAPAMPEKLLNGAPTPTPASITKAHKDEAATPTFNPEAVKADHAEQLKHIPKAPGAEGYDSKAGEDFNGAFKVASDHQALMTEKRETAHDALSIKNQTMMGQSSNDAMNDAFGSPVSSNSSLLNVGRDALSQIAKPIADMVTSASDGGVDIRVNEISKGVGGELKTVGYSNQSPGAAMGRLGAMNHPLETEVKPLHKETPLPKNETPSPKMTSSPPEDNGK